jgi:hypothetical protein
MRDASEVGMSDLDLLTAPIWASKCKTIEVVPSPDDAGIKVLHHGNGSVVWLSENEAIELAIKIFAHCRISL